jgi:hypothetical protein
VKEYIYYLNRKAKYKKVIGIFRFDKSKPNDTPGEYMQFSQDKTWRWCAGTHYGVRNGILCGRSYCKTSPKKVEELLFLRKL